MKRHAVLVLLLLLAASSFGQEKQAAKPYSMFDGEWVLDPEKSSPFKQGVKFPEFTWLIESGSGSIAVAMGMCRLMISPTRSYLVDRTSMILRPDSDSEINKYLTGKETFEIKSTTAFADRQLVRRYETTLEVRMGSENKQIISGITEEYILSKDGNQLTFKSSARYRDAPQEYLATMSSVPLDRVFKFIFTRKSSNTGQTKEKSNR